MKNEVYILQKGYTEVYWSDLNKPPPFKREPVYMPNRLVFSPSKPNVSGSSKDKNKWSLL